MKGKKWIAIALAAATACLSFAGCAGDPDETGGGSGGGKEFGKGGKELRYRVSNDATQMAWVQRIVDGFNEKYKSDGYVIKVETTGNEYYQSLDSDFAAKRAPDIILQEIGTIASYLEQGYLIPLDEFIDREGGIERGDLWQVNDWFKWSKEKGLNDSNGKIYSLVKDWSPDFMLIYNKTMVNQYNASHADQITISETEPLSWDEYFTIAQKMSSTGVRATTMDFEPYKHLMEFVQMTGESLFTADGNRVNLSFTGNTPDENSGVKKAFEYFCKLQYGPNSPAPNTTGATESGGMEKFLNGNIWSVWNGLYAFPQYQLYNANFEIGIAPPPVYDKTKGAYAATSAMVGHSINAQCKYPEIAYKFIEYYMTEGASEYVGMGYNLPGLESVAKSDAFLHPATTQMEPYTNYMYRFVTNENNTVEPLRFSPNLSYNRLGALLSPPLAKYFGGNQDFNSMLKEFCNLVEEELAEW